MGEVRLYEFTDKPAVNHFSLCYYICLMMSSMFPLIALQVFPLQVLDKWDLVVLDFGILTWLSIFTGIQISVSNRQELLYVYIFIGIFIVFFVFTQTKIDLVHEYDCKTIVSQSIELYTYLYLFQQHHTFQEPSVFRETLFKIVATGFIKKYLKFYDYWPHGVPQVTII